MDSKTYSKGYNKKNQQTEHLVIDANFKPPKGLKFLKLLTAGLVVLVLVVLVAGWISTAIVVQVESQITQVGQETRQANEDIKNLQVNLHQLQSLQKVAKTATYLPYLKPVADNRLAVDATRLADFRWPQFNPRVRRQLPSSQF